MLDPRRVPVRHGYPRRRHRDVCQGYYPAARPPRPSTAHSNFVRSRTVNTFHVAFDDSRNYDIVIDADAGKRQGGPPKPEIEWWLSESSKIVAEGNTVDRPLGDSYPTIELKRGPFTGDVGNRYTAATMAASNTSRRTAANPAPKLQILRRINEVEPWVAGVVCLLTIGATLVISKISDKRRAFTA